MVGTSLEILSDRIFIFNDQRAHDTNLNVRMNLDGFRCSGRTAIGVLLMFLARLSNQLNMRSIKVPSTD